MQDHSLARTPKIDPNAVPQAVLAVVDTLTEAQMMSLRHHIDMVLKVEINQLNLTEELGLQFRQGKELLVSIMNDPGVPANQKAQVFNSVQAQVDKIIKQRTQVFSQERLKRFESALLKVLEMQKDDAAREVFLDLYGDLLQDRGN